MTPRIVCPKCGAEYLLEEIFMSDDIIGSRMTIKDSKGKIVHIEGTEPDLSAEYVCDYCDTKFIVTASINTMTQFAEDLWDDEYSVEIFKDRIDLEE